MGSIESYGVGGRGIVELRGLDPAGEIARVSFAGDPFREDSRRDGLAGEASNLRGDKNREVAGRLFLSHVVGGSPARSGSPRRLPRSRQWARLRAGPPGGGATCRV